MTEQEQKDTSEQEVVQPPLLTIGFINGAIFDIVADSYYVDAEEEMLFLSLGDVETLAAPRNSVIFVMDAKRYLVGSNITQSQSDAAQQPQKRARRTAKPYRRS